MRITCPACTTSYTIPDDKVGAKGRSVRCASCGSKWHVDAPTGFEPEPAEDLFNPASSRDEDPVSQVDSAWSEESDADSAIAGNAAGPAAAAFAADSEPVAFSAREPAQANSGKSASETGAAQTEADIDLEAQLAEINKNKDIESYAKKPKIKVSKKKAPKVRKPFKFDMDRFLVRARPVFGALVLVLSLSVIALAVLLRTPMVAAFPSLASLYQMVGMPVNLRGLDFANLQMLREVDNGQPVLVVEGELFNPGTLERVVPAIRFSLRGDDAQEIYAWSIEPKTTMLTPGATMRFRSRLASPPDQAADIQVRMIDRRNRQASIE